MKNAFFLIFVFCLVSINSMTSAYADIYIEPFAGFGMYKNDGDSGSGPVYGGRLGYGLLGFAAGAQYTAFSGKTDADADSTGAKSFDISGSNAGIFASFKFPILFRLWATYYLSSEGKIKNYSIDPDGAGGTAAVNGDVSLKGGGTEFGVGFTGIPFVDISLSMSTIKYDDNDHPITKTVSGVTVESTDFTMYMLTLSLPLSL